jgi:hypothetical protein
MVSLETALGIGADKISGFAAAAGLALWGRFAGDWIFCAEDIKINY